MVGKFERCGSYDDYKVRFFYRVPMGGSYNLSENSSYSVALDRFSHLPAGHYPDLAPSPFDRTRVYGHVLV